MGGSPAFLSAIVAVVGAFIVGIAALGQWCTVYTRNWRSAADSSKALADALQEQLEETKRDRQELEQRISLTDQKHVEAIKLMEVRMAAWEAQVADAQRVIHHLQVKLDVSEARHARIDREHEVRNQKQHPEGK